MAEVLDSNLSLFGMTVVVKQMKNVEMTQKNVDLFNQEISLMEYFKKHPNIAKILGYSINPYCIIMKFYRLNSLKYWLMHRKVETKILKYFFIKDIIYGVQVLHMKGVAHMDLKPDNILIDLYERKQPICVITDFGISQVVNQDILIVKMFHALKINGLSKPQSV